MLNIGVIGYGYWGPNIVRNFNGIDSAKVVALCDLNDGALAKATKLYPAIQGNNRPSDDIFRQKTSMQLPSLPRVHPF